MKRFSINNGVSFVDMENLTMKECIFISDYWDLIISSMDDDTMEEVNNYTDVENTKTLQGKIDYINDYLLYGDCNLEIG